MHSTVDLSDYLPDAVIPERTARAEERALRAINRLGRALTLGPASDTVRVGDEPSYTRCANDPWYLELTDPFRQLAYMLNAFDGQRAKQRRKSQGTPSAITLTAPPPPIRVPQARRLRRSWLFSAQDIPSLLLERMSPSEVTAHVEAVRYALMERALDTMREGNELWFYPNDELWQVPVHVMDQYRCPGHGTNRVKNDKRPFHGRPNRDRRIGIPLGST